MPRKDINNDVREVNVAAHQSGKGYLSSYREKDYSQVENIQDSCQSSQEWTSQQVHPKVKNPRATSQTLQASVSVLNVKVHDSTIRKRLNKYGLFGRVGGESLFSLKSLQSCIWTNHKTSGTMSFGQTRPKWRCLVIMHSSTSGENQTCHTNCQARWWRADDLGLFWDLGTLQSTMNSSVYQSILESNVRPSVWQLKLGWNLSCKKPLT